MTTAYFLDPDLLAAGYFRRLDCPHKSASCPELPGQMRERFINDLGLSAYDAAALTASSKWPLFSS